MQNDSSPLHARLPKEFQPRITDELVRIGRDHDGGYLLDGRNLRNADFLVGFGINDDWSFEEQFLRYRQVPLFAFDGTIGKRVFLKKLLHAALFRIFSPGEARHWLNTFLKYCHFFRGDRRHISRMVGLDTLPNFVSVSTIFAQYLPPHAASVFLKVDIEGAEYRILDELVAFSERIEGLVIEFHDVDLHLDRIANFIFRFPLELCHVHCNNFAVLDQNNVPLVIELSFTRHPLADGHVEQLPASLDMPNQPGKLDYPISFAQE